MLTSVTLVCSPKIISDVDKYLKTEIKYTQSDAGKEKTWRLNLDCVKDIDFVVSGRPSVQ